MFIETQTTPNPETLKFIPGQKILDGQGVEIKSEAEAKDSHLAQRLFDIAEVSSVFIGNDFVSVTKKTGEWPELKPIILSVLMEHFLSGEPAIAKESIVQHSYNQAHYSKEDKDIVSAICNLIDTRVRPAVAHDGGDIVFHRYEQGVVFLEMRGACAGCPISSVTLKQGIENLLKHFVPQVTEVRAVEL